MKVFLFGGSELFGIEAEQVEIEYIKSKMYIFAPRG
jgi:hypothetical protein